MSLTETQEPQAYRRHLQRLQRLYDQAMSEQQLEGVLIHSGSPDYFFQDDQQRPFRINPWFLHWVPLTDHPDAFLLLRPGRTPQLFCCHRSDFWHQPAALPEGEWSDHFDIVEIDDVLSVQGAIAGLAGLAYLGPNPALARGWGLEAINPEGLINRLDWHRAVKSDYEVDCLYRANRRAVAGHRAVEAAFAGEAGVSEFQLFLAYQQGCAQPQSEFPYHAIIALNQHASVLHYQHYQHRAPAERRSLLIDAGASVDGYGSDITRSYSAGDGLYRELILALDQLQQRLAASLRPGVAFTDYHIQACEGIATLLQQAGLVDADPQQQLAEGIVTRFFPHGLGHLLGLQVHDRGGLLQGPDGAERPPPEAHPFLRLTRQLETGMVLTVEPGIYFIDSLLEPLRAEKAGRRINWPLVDSLRPAGGIRIEDNVWLAPEGPVNLTRRAFARVESSTKDQSN